MTVDTPDKIHQAGRELATQLAMKGQKEEALLVRRLVGMSSGFEREANHLRGAITNAELVATETAKCWEDRCRKILDALGLDFGPMPEHMKELQLGQLEFAAGNYLQDIDRGNMESAEKCRDEMRIILALASQPPTPKI